MTSSYNYWDSARHKLCAVSVLTIMNIHTKCNLQINSCKRNQKISLLVSENSPLHFAFAITIPLSLSSSDGPGNWGKHRPPSYSTIYLMWDEINTRGVLTHFSAPLAEYWIRSLTWHPRVTINAAKENVELIWRNP